MASTSSTKKKNEPSSVFKQAERPHFFKVILQDSIPQLAIPRKFVKTYGDILSSPVVTLKVPNGAKWKVEIVRSDGRIWLQNGWREFAQHYSVVVGSFIVFEYEKSASQFNVIIFDNSTTEIEYPDPLANSSNGDSAERANLFREQEERVPQEPIKKKIKLESSPNTSLNQCYPAGNRKESITEKKKSKSKEQKRKLSFSNPCEAPKKYTSSSANLSFQAKLSPAVVRNSMVYVPRCFIRKLKSREIKSVRLTINNDKCWPVKLIKHSGFGYLSAGWTAFARENSLKVKDVCTFQLISTTDQTPLISVSITRNSSVTNRVEREAEPKVLLGRKEKSSSQPQPSQSIKVENVL